MSEKARELAAIRCIGVYTGDNFDDSCDRCAAFIDGFAAGAAEERARTIEECAKVADEMFNGFPYEYDGDVAAAIRALAEGGRRE